MKNKDAKIKVIANQVKANLILAMLLVPVLIFGQGRNQEVTIIAPYQATISDAFKLQLNPAVADSAVEMPRLDYSIQAEPYYTTFEVQPLDPVFIQVDPEETLTRNYLRAGFGNYTMPYVELFSNSLASDEFSLGFHARHLSSQGEIEDYAHSAFSHNRVGLYGKRYLKNRVLSAKVFYNRDVVHYYGYKPVDYTTVDLTEEQLKQRYSLLGLNTSLASNHKRNNKLNYDAALSFYRLDDLYETSETFVGFDANINSQDDIFGFADQQELGVDFRAGYYHNSDSIDSQGNILASLKPYVSFNLEYLDLTLGVEGAMAGDSATEFYIYPAVRASYQVIPDYLRFYAAASGGLQRNSFRKVTEANPWANSIFPMGFTNTKYEIRAGITGRFDLLVDYNFSVSWSEVENMMFFINDFYSSFSPEIPVVLGNKFTAVYDDVKLTTVRLEAGYEQIERLDILFNASYRNYQMSTEAEPWHKPALEADILGEYFVTPDFSVSGQLFFQSQIYAKVLREGELQIAKRGAYADINLGAEYRFNDRVSAFAQINNVAATRYFRWYNYPSQRISAMGGLTFSF
ncbi:MAG: hypothetical protein ACLFPE_02285 [Bacteroidales bacterium]